MRKKLLRIIFVFVIGFLFLGKIEAKNYAFSCDYMGSDNKQYILTFSVDGETLNVTQAIINPNGNVQIKMENIEWKNNSDCPGEITLTQKDGITYGKLGRDESGIVLKHYWTWDCTYKIEDGTMNSMTIKYADYGQYGTENYFVTNKISYNFPGDNKPSISYSKLITGSIESKSNYKKKCVPIDYKIENGTLEVTFSDSGTYKGKKNDFSYNKEVLTTAPSSCLDYKTEGACETDEDVACIWVENEDSPNGGYCNVDNLIYVGCGGASDIPHQVPSLISLFVNLLKIATPIILIFIGMISLFKAMAAGKEDEMKKAQSSLVKKIIAAVLVFFVVAIVQFIVSIVSSDESEYEGFEDCLNCFLNNNCSTSTYYKTVISGEDWCTPLTTGKSDLCENMFK